MSDLEETSRKVEEMLLTAVKQRETDIAAAIATSKEAAKMLQMADANHEHGTVRNVTQDKGSLEVLYLSKIAGVYYELKNYDESLKHYKELAPKLKGVFEVFKAMGDCYRKKRDFEAAIEQYEKGFKILEADDNAGPAQGAPLLNSRGLAYMDMNDHEKAKADFNEACNLDKTNALYCCNSASALYNAGARDEAIKRFEKAQELADAIDPQKPPQGLTTHNVNFIKQSLKTLITHLKEFEEIKVRSSDKVMADRQKEFAKNATNLTDQSKNLEDEGSKILEIKKQIKYFEEDGNDNLLEYYDGFLSELETTFLTAKIVSSGQLSLDTGDSRVSILTSIVSFAPFCGSQVASSIKTLWEFTKSADMKKCANNVIKFATLSRDFCDMAQDAIVTAITKREKELKALDPVPYVIPSWSSAFKAIAAKLEVKLYGERNETDMQKVGYQTAKDMLSKYIANEKFYEGMPVIKMKPAQRSEKLKQVVLDMLDKDIKASEEKKVFKETPQAEGKACCQIF